MLRRVTYTLALINKDTSFLRKCKYYNKYPQKWLIVIQFWFQSTSSPYNHKVRTVSLKQASQFHVEDHFSLIKEMRYFCTNLYCYAVS